MGGDNEADHGCILIGVLTSAGSSSIASGRECGAPPSRQTATPAERLSPQTLLTWAAGVILPPNGAQRAMNRKIRTGSNAFADRTLVTATTCSPLDPRCAQACGISLLEFAGSLKDSGCPTKAVAICTCRKPRVQSWAALGVTLAAAKVGFGPARQSHSRHRLFAH